MAVNAHAAPVLHVDAGQLLGANNVAVNGVNYNVQFKDGACASLLGQCGSSANFFFNNQSDAEAASHALLSSVFVDSAQGLFGSDPTLTNGCINTELCQVFTPFPPTPEGFPSFAIALNYAASVLTADTVQVYITNRPFGDTTNIPGYTYAVWSLTPVSEIPEPSTIWLAVLALALLAWKHSTQRS